MKPEAPRPDGRPDPPPAGGSPYGPQYGQVDESAGGADSSPFENEPSGMKYDAAHAPERRDRQPPA